MNITNTHMSKHEHFGHSFGGAYPGNLSYICRKSLQWLFAMKIPVVLSFL